MANFSVEKAAAYLQQEEQMDKYLERDRGAAGGRDNSALLADVRVEARRREQAPLDSGEWAGRGDDAFGAAEEKGSGGGGDRPTYGYRDDRPNTGPKGVLEDHRDFQRAEYEQWQADQAERINIWTGTNNQANGSSVSQGDKRVHGGDGGDDDDDDDDKFLQEYRARRILEMQKQLEQSMARPTFGHVRNVSADQYFEVVEKAQPGVNVVVAFSNPDLQVCRRLDRFLGDVATRHPAVSFVRVQSDEIDDLFSAEDLPVMVFYRDGKPLSTVPRLAAHLGSDFTAKHLTRFLISVNMIEMSETEDEYEEEDD